MADETSLIAAAQALAAQFLEARRVKHGDLRMEATDGDEASDDAPDGAGQADDDQGQGQDDDGQLGDAGKQALDRMKAENKRLRDELKAALASGGDKDRVQSVRDRAQAQLREQIAELTAKLDGREAEYQAEKAARETEAAAVSKANQRLVKAEIRAAAAGKLADPADAHNFLDLSQFEVDDDGNVDGDAIADAIEDLITKKPYLAAQGRRFQGGADGGARKESSKSIDDQIAEAEKARNFQLVIALKQQKAASATKS